jgi:hypothetical protein
MLAFRNATYPLFAGSALYRAVISEVLRRGQVTRAQNPLSSSPARTLRISSCTGSPKAGGRVLGTGAAGCPGAAAGTGRITPDVE